MKPSQQCRRNRFVSGASFDRRQFEETRRNEAAADNNWRLRISASTVIPQKERQENRLSSPCVRSAAGEPRLSCPNPQTDPVLWLASVSVFEHCCVRGVARSKVTLTVMAADSRHLSL